MILDISVVPLNMALPGVLVCGNIDFNDPKTVRQVLTTVQRLLADQSRYFRMLVSKRYYFSASAALTPFPGWYILLDSEGKSLYAGQAEDLNSRLNSEDGSRDQFANPQRTSDPARNFIKVFAQSGVVNGLVACLITEDDLRKGLGAPSPLSKLDRDNVEKFLNITRSWLQYSVS